MAHGVGAYVGEQKVVIGSRHFWKMTKNIEFGLLNGVIDEELKKGRTLLYIGYEGKLLGLYL